ncbi:MAG: SPASM domain-containing protein, partial [Pseudobdellovibrio sp.]
VITQHEQDENKENYIFNDVFKSLDTADREKVIFRSYRDLKLVNRAGILKQIAQEGLALQACYIPSHMLTVSVDARVISCFEDYNENLVFGDLKKEKLIDIWHKDSYKQFRGSLQKGLRHLFVTCKDCSRKEALPPFDI